MDCLGNLNRCQAACCKVLVFFLRDPANINQHPILYNPSQDLLNYYKLHNCKLERIDHSNWKVIVEGERQLFQMSKNLWRMLITVNCQALTQDNLCGLHGTEEKPRVCRRFDENHTEGYFIPDKCILKEEA